MTATRDRKPEDELCAIYARAATGGPGAVEKQARAAREALARRAIASGPEATVREHRDVDTTGVGEPGPALTAMLDDAAAGKIDVVIVRDLARLGRSPRRLAAVAAAIERAGARIVILQGGHGDAAARLAAPADTSTSGKG